MRQLFSQEPIVSSVLNIYPSSNFKGLLFISSRELTQLEKAENDFVIFGEYSNVYFLICHYTFRQQLLRKPEWDHPTLMSSYP